ncbi:MAG: carboxypeptidase regulatory-like domain-containing protein [Pyrinomonadaceae bacterium]
MRSKSSHFAVCIFPSLILFCVFVIPVYASTITGTIYDNRRNPLPEVNVELLNDYYQVINRSVTEASGRYEFGGLADGRYSVKVLPFRYDLLEQTQQIEIYTNKVRGTGSGNTTEIKDFFLSPRRGSLDEAEAGVIFAQEIPKDAKKAYETAVDLFTKNRRPEALAEIKRAINIFPNYFLALNRLGREFVVEGKYGDAFPILMKASDTNPKSPTALYYLGYTLYKLSYNKAALVALKQAYILSPTSVPLLWTLGSVERLEGQLPDAEKHLVQAKKLTRVEIPDLRFELALLFRDLGKFGLAADELEAFLKGRPDAKDGDKIKKLIKTYREKTKS